MSRPSVLPLTYSQEHMWVTEQLQPGSTAYVVPAAFRTPADIDTDMLEWSMSEIVARHEILRTTFKRAPNGRPCMVVHDPASFPTIRVSRHSVPVASQVKSRMARALRTPFDLENGPLVRLQLYTVRGSATEATLLVAMHHMVIDGLSSGVLVRELTELNQAYTESHRRAAGGATGAGAPARLRVKSLASLPPLAIQFADFALWERAQMQSAATATHLAYWREQLELVPVLPLVTDYPRPEDVRFAGAQLPIRVPPEVLPGLRKLQQSLGVSLFSALLGAWTLLLSRHTHCNDVAVAVPLGSRAPETANMIGNFVNTVVVRTNLDDGPTFEELAHRVAAHMVDALTHNVPFSVLLKELAPKRLPGITPLAQNMFTVLPQQAHNGGEFGGQNALEPLEIDPETSQFDMALHLVEGASTLEGYLEYRTDLFAKASVQSIADHFVELVTQLASMPLSLAQSKPAHGVRMMGDAEEKALIAAWNSLYEGGMRSLSGQGGGTGVQLPHNLLHVRVLRNIRRLPNKVCLTSGVANDSDVVNITYGELGDLSRTLAMHLRDACGVKVGDIVGIYMPKRVEFPVAMMGILRSGAAYMPLDPTYPEARIQGIISDSKVRVIVTLGSDTQVPVPASAGKVHIVRLQAGGLAAGATLQREPRGELAAGAGDDIAPGVTAHEGCYVEYTSGSTGKPKGVKVTHLNTCSMFDAALEHFGTVESDVWSVYCSFGFDLSVYETFGALSYGGRAVVVPHDVAVAPSAYWSVCHREGVTAMWQTPLAFEHFDRADKRAEGKVGRLSSLRLVIFCGDKLEPGKLRDWFSRHGDTVRLVNTYGITETTVCSTIRWITSADVDMEVSPIGLCMDNQMFFVLNEAQEPVPTGVPGEMWIAGECVAPGYLGRPELTKDRFRDLRFCPGFKCYKTGDLVRFSPAGEFEFMGRVDHQVKIRGFRVELGEIEEQLLADDRVTKATVLPPGKGWSMLFAFVAAPDVSPGDDANKLAEDLLARCVKVLPAYMVPHSLQVLPKLPTSRNGKLDKTELQRVIKQQRTGGAMAKVGASRMGSV